MVKLSKISSSAQMTMTVAGTTRSKYNEKNEKRKIKNTRYTFHVIAILENTRSALRDARQSKNMYYSFFTFHFSFTPLSPVHWQGRGTAPPRR